MMGEAANSESEVEFSIEATASPPETQTANYKTLVKKLKKFRVSASSNESSSRDSGCKKMTANVAEARSTSDHGGGEQSICSDHGLEKDQFCLDDNILVCLKCLLYGLHKKHKSLDLDRDEDR